MPFLGEFVVILAAAVIVILVSQLIRLPAVVGFLLTGILIGPSGLRLVTDPAQLDAFAEIGVVFLLFTIGLEFSLGRLRQIGRAFFVGGSLQTGGTIFAVAAIATALGQPPAAAFFYGFLAALSSTAIVLKHYAERRELEAPHGKVMIGVLLFQDVLIVPLILLTPALAGTAEASAGALLLRFGIGMLIAAAVFGLARFLMPHLLYALVRTQIRELVVLGALLAGLSFALGTEAFGFSLALGAFLAGILIAESDYSAQIVAEMSPFRDVFTSLFFIAIGMLLDLEFAAAHAGTILGLAALLVGLKALILAGTARVLGYRARTMILAALSLAQLGEFSFVVAEVGRDAGLLPTATYQTFLATAILTMLATPFLIRGAQALAGRRRAGDLAVGGPAPAATGETAPGKHVVIVGFGLNGQNLARILREMHIPYVVLELSGDVVRRARAAGETVLYGDATRPDILNACGLERATAIVFGISDLWAVHRGVSLARQLNPDVFILVRTRQVADIEALVASGADEVVAEEFETSIEIVTRLLERLGIPPNVILAQAKVLRGDRYGVLRGALGAGDVSEAVLEVMGAGTAAVFFVRDAHAIAGRTLGELEVRRRTGVTVISVVREGLAHPSPGPSFAIAAGDSLVLMGNHGEIGRAFDHLEGGPEDQRRAPHRD
ncbi:MAG: cation:proton antiporter [Gemmatimonadota bacterium]